MSDSEEQDDELLALESIYDPTILTINHTTADKGGQFEAVAQLPEPFFIQSNSVTQDSSEPVLHKIKYLPPLVLNFQLPVNYPSVSPPSFTITCKWLTRHQLSQVCQRLDALWEENAGTVILFTWINFLHEELFNFLQLTSPLDIRNVVDHQKMKKEPDIVNCDPRCIQDIENQNWLLVAILDYDKQLRREHFKKSVFLCNVCFSEKPGSSCLQFHDCEHVFCAECMREYFVVQINDGNVKSLICPHEKCESEAHPSQVKELVPEDKYKRYDELLLKASLDMMLDIVYCPRTMCQCPVLMEKDSNIGSCPSCQYVFCRLCKLVYHGLSPCRLKSKELNALREEYEAASEEGKRFLEQKYGKKIIRQALEESITQEWLDLNAKPCPACGTNIQKIDGCNKMTCIKCRNYFCWLCGESLSRSNPYGHFNRKGPCMNRLFEGMDENEFDEEDFIDAWW